MSDQEPGLQTKPRIPIHSIKQAYEALDTESLSQDEVLQTISPEAVRASLTIENEGLWSEPLPDGTIFAYTYNSDGGPRIRLNEQGQLVLRQPYGDFTVIDPKRDPALAGTLEVVRSFQSQVESLYPLERIAWLTKYVRDSFSNRADEPDMARKRHDRLTEAMVPPKIFSAGFARKYGFGFCRHRSSWLKRVADELVMPAILVRIKGDNDHAGHLFVLFPELHPNGGRFMADPQSETDEWPLYPEVFSPKKETPEDPYKLIAGLKGQGAIYQRKADIKVVMPKGVIIYFDNKPFYKNPPGWRQINPRLS